MKKKLEAFKAFFKWPGLRHLIPAPYLVVILYAVNQSIQINQNYVFDFPIALLSTLALLLVAFLTDLLFRVLLIERHKSAIMATFVVFLLCYYFDLYTLIYDYVPGVAHYISSGYNLFLVALYHLAAILLAQILKLFKKKIAVVSTYLSVVLFLFILLEFGKAAFHRPFYPQLVSPLRGKEMKTKNDSLSKPDIYYIIFDSYTSSRSLRKYWGYKNPLDSLLPARGFYLAKGSHSNYNGTNYSVASSLNMAYFDIKSWEQDVRVPQSVLDQLPANSVVADFLKNQGYEIKAFTLFDFMGIQNFYGIDHNPMRFLNRTFLHLIEVKSGRAHLSPFYVEKQKNLAVIDSLKAMSHQKVAQPRFVYAHIYLPHPPFFYDERGEVMTDEYALGAISKEKYLSQLKYVNILIADMIEQLLSDTTYKPVIILQGDHGFRFLQGEQSHNTPEEGSTILNAYYLPDKDYRTFYDSITPVNSFRLILNNYFGTGLPLLRDTSYYLQEEKGFRNF
jgi:hypothetical protein